MKLKFILLFVLCNCAFYAQESSENPVVNEGVVSGAGIQFESETVDYGQIEYDANSLREFKFINSGNIPLNITKVQGQCGCTTTVIDGKPGWPTEPILPGKEGIIKVKYDTKRPGKFDKKIMVYANIAGDLKTLTVKGEVKPAK